MNNTYRYKLKSIPIGINLIADIKKPAQGGLVGNKKPARGGSYLKRYMVMGLAMADDIFAKNFAYGPFGRLMWLRLDGNIFLISLCLQAVRQTQFHCSEPAKY
jgi:hypothetical protein